MVPVRTKVCPHCEQKLKQRQSDRVFSSDLPRDGMRNVSIITGGSLTDIDDFERAEIERSVGKVKPKGFGPD